MATRSIAHHLMDAIQEYVYVRREEAPTLTSIASLVMLGDAHRYQGHGELGNFAK
jgi:hypothetical protein